MCAALTAAISRQASPDSRKVLPFTATRAAEGEARQPAALNRTDHTRPRENAYRICAALVLGDFLVALAAISLGLAAREWQRLGSLMTSESHALLFSQLPLWSFAGAALFTWLMVASKTYEVTNLYRMHRWLRSLLKSTGLWSIAIWAVIGLFQFDGFAPRVGVLYCAAALIISLTLWRLAAFVVLVQPRLRETASSRIIMVGWNPAGTRLRRALRRDLAQLSEIIGCVPLPGGHFSVRPPADLAILGDYSALPRLVAECGADSVVLADVSCSAREIQDLISFCQREMITFQMVPEYFPALNSGLQVQVVSGVPLLGVTQLPLDRTVNRFLKRSIDIVGALVGLLLSLPLIAIFGTLVHLESPGPIIYPQRRTSRSGRVFTIYKIRSMPINAEAESGAVWCTREDPRRLKIGAFMRKYNIDELPQFWNVLTGDMSLVGPRPERPELIEKFKDEIPNYNARHEIRTGLTGWAQINGLRGDTDLRKRVEADLYYLENWSVFLDFTCLVGTIFNNKNAH
jgi:exopolysaccharide biosynthesis polyprenyl glycosylphosphotransferase